MFEILNESTAQKERFRTAANKLLNQCFLLKKKEDTKREYIFVRQNKEMFVEYFDLLGYEIRINEDQGVITLVNQFGIGRLSLNKYESILLLILRLLYIERRKELSSSSDEIIVLMEEIREKYAILKIKTKPMLDKTMEKRMVSLFKKYNLILNLDADIHQADARILIYPSILLAVPVEEINSYYETMENKLKEYAGGYGDGESEEVADEGPAD